MKEGGQLHVAVYQQGKPAGSDWIGDWVNSRASLDAVAKKISVRVGNRTSVSFFLIKFYTFYFS
jgi:hypothetical protein